MTRTAWLLALLVVLGVLAAGLYLWRAEGGAPTIEGPGDLVLGSDPAEVAFVLSDDGSHYVINGTKSWVSNAPYADYIVLFTLTDPEARHHGVTAFLIDTDKPGFKRGKKEPKLGIRASATSEIVFTDYVCPVENRIGEEGEGFRIAMKTLESGRIGIAAQAVGIAEAALEASIEYAKEREAFGQKIGQFQMIQQKLADMKTRTEAATLLTYQAAEAKTHPIAAGGGPVPLGPSTAKLRA